MQFQVRPSRILEPSGCGSCGHSGWDRRNWSQDAAEFLNRFFEYDEEWLQSISLKATTYNFVESWASSVIVLPRLHRHHLADCSLCLGTVVSLATAKKHLAKDLCSVTTCQVWVASLGAWLLIIAIVTQTCKVIQRCCSLALNLLLQNSGQLSITWWSQVLLSIFASSANVGHQLKPRPQLRIYLAG